MKRKRYSEAQIISILKAHEAGASMADLSRESRDGRAATPGHGSLNRVLTS